MAKIFQFEASRRKDGSTDLERFNQSRGHSGAHGRQPLFTRRGKLFRFGTLRRQASIASGAVDFVLPLIGCSIRVSTAAAKYKTTKSCSRLQAYQRCDVKWFLLGLQECWFCSEKAA